MFSTMIPWVTRPPATVPTPGTSNSSSTWPRQGYSLLPSRSHLELGQLLLQLAGLPLAHAGGEQVEELLHSR